MRSPDGQGNSPRLTRRRNPEARGETWSIRYDGVRVGTIAALAGLNGSTQWVWSCGFHTGLPAGRIRNGATPAMPDARKGFEAAWVEYLPTRKPADFDDWRHHAAWTAEKTRDGSVATAAPRRGRCPDLFSAVQRATGRFKSAGTSLPSSSW